MRANPVPVRFSEDEKAALEHHLKATGRRRNATIRAAVRRYLALGAELAEAELAAAGIPHRSTLGSAHDRPEAQPD